MSSRLFRIADWEKLAAAAKYKPEAMAALSGVGLRQLQRFCNAQFGKCPGDGLREIRCKRAAELISQGYHTKEAATEAGFANASHLCREFKKVYGDSPQSFSPAANKWAVGGEMSL